MAKSWSSGLGHFENSPTISILILPRRETGRWKGKFHAFSPRKDGEKGIWYSTGCILPRKKGRWYAFSLFWGEKREKVDGKKNTLTWKNCFLSFRKKIRSFFKKCAFSWSPVWALCQDSNLVPAIFLNGQFRIFFCYLPVELTPLVCFLHVIPFYFLLSKNFYWTTMRANVKESAWSLLELLALIEFFPHIVTCMASNCFSLGQGK